jgi:hypothetical protein
VTRLLSTRSRIKLASDRARTNREHDHAATDATPMLESSRIVNAAIGESISKFRERHAGRGAGGQPVFKFAALRAPEGAPEHPRWDSVGSAKGGCAAHKGAGVLANHVKLGSTSRRVAAKSSPNGSAGTS